MFRIAGERQGTNGSTFHFQITASGLKKLGTDSEAELFKKIPTLEHLERHAARERRHRGHHDPRHRGDDAAQSGQLHRSVGDSRRTSIARRRSSHSATRRQARRNFRAATETNNDRATWDEMDAVSDKIALIFAGNEPFEILAERQPA